MPKATSGGESNAWRQREAGLPPPPPASAPKADHVSYVADALGVPADEAAALTKPELVELGRSGVPPRHGQPEER